MGTTTFVGSSQKAGRRSYDLPLLLILGLLMLFGLVILLSASWDYSNQLYEDPWYMIRRQAQWAGVGLILLLVLSHVDYHHWQRWIVPVMGTTLILLLLVLFIGELHLGARRTLFKGSYQPSELAKLVVILYLSVWLYSKRQFLHDVSFGLLPLSVILGLVGGLIYLQPDLSATLTVVLLGGLLFFLAGGRWSQIAVVILLTLIILWLVVQINPTGQARVAAYLAGLRDPTQSSYHMRRVFEAFVRGGFLGRGLGESVTKLNGLPVPPTDSIFAVLVEETGFVGALVLFGLYGLLGWRGLLLAQRAPDMLGTLMASGITFWILLEMLINTGVMIGLIPFAGNALPFFSAGGSNLIACLAGMGILLNIARQADEAVTEEQWRSYGAIIDLRRGNRRRRVSRARRA
jgi:cell division protein FtsW